MIKINQLGLNERVSFYIGNMGSLRGVLVFTYQERRSLGLKCLTHFLTWVARLGGLDCASPSSSNRQEGFRTRPHWGNVNRGLGSPESNLT